MHSNAGNGGKGKGGLQAAERGFTAERLPRGGQAWDPQRASVGGEY